MIKKQLLFLIALSESFLMQASEVTIPFSVNNQTGQAYLVIVWTSAHHQAWKILNPGQKANMPCVPSSLVSIRPAPKTNTRGQEDHFHAPGAYTVDPTRTSNHTISGSTARKNNKNAPQGAY